MHILYGGASSCSFEIEAISSDPMILNYPCIWKTDIEDRVIDFDIFRANSNWTPYHGDFHFDVALCDIVDKSTADIILAMKTLHISGLVEEIPKFITWNEEWNNGTLVKSTKPDIELIKQNINKIVTGNEEDTEI